MSSSPSSPLNEQAVLSKYKELQSDCHGLITKITELEQDRNEHKLVEQTLAPLDVNRRAFRLVGGVLVERTVGEVLPSVKSNRENVSALLFEKNLSTHTNFCRISHCFHHSLLLLLTAIL